jgi:hypothetical protein
MYTKLYQVDVITKQADELKLLYDKQPTEENKNKWFEKIKEVEQFSYLLDPEQDKLVKYDWINNDKK